MASQARVSLAEFDARVDDFEAIWAAFVRDGAAIVQQVRQLEEQGQIRTLANPSLLARSGEKAEFLAGGEAALKHGAKGADSQQREVQQLRKQLEEREQIIGELTVANKFLKKLSAPSG